ncbi:MAG TPA: hypothetical protein VKP30_09545 [Polyangiaceae bacterium]|nr:hypothetical protein [Polyangiaceae bacterium]
MGRKPVTGVDAPRAQASIMASLTIVRSVATLAPRRVIAGRIAMAQKPVQAVLE